VTPAERRIFWSVAVVSALARFASRARSLWDWDEALFCLGMRSFDVTQHHPHPPGFPVYIALGRAVRLILGDDFRSLQTINLIAGMLLFPAVFLLARELGFRFSTSTIAGALCAFFPSVWFYGGSAFSDVPSITIVVYAAAFLLRGRRDARAYLFGTFLLAIAIGIRPQNALIGLFPLIVSTTKRRPREVAAAAVIGILVVGAAFGGAAMATGIDRYRDAVRMHSEYISSVDSFRSPLRPALWRLIGAFFAKQYSFPPLDIVMTLFVIIAIVAGIRSGDRGLRDVALIFGPFAFAAWLFLDRYTVNRFSIGYAPMFAIFAADGIRRIAGRRDSWVGAAVVAAFIAFTLPSFTAVRNDVAPSVLATLAAKEHFNPEVDDLYVAADMRPFLDYFMPGVPYMNVLDERAMPLSSIGKTPRLVAEIFPTEPAGYVFRREKGRLWNISRRHYYAAAYATMTRVPQYVSGWYGGERVGSDEWRFLAERSTAMLPPSTGESLLRLGFIVDAPARVTVAMNGQTLDTLQVDGMLQRDWHVIPVPGPNRLDITTDGDHKVRVRYLSWNAY
jgi:hypothetical protein